MNPRNPWFLIAFGRVWPPHRPKEINPVDLLQRVVFELLVGWPLFGLKMIGASIYGIIFGLRPRYFKAHCTHSFDFTEIKYWPRIGEFRILPIYGVFVLMAMYDPAMLFVIILAFVTMMGGILGRSTTQSPSRRSVTFGRRSWRASARCETPRPTSSSADRLFGASGGTPC